MYLRGPQSLLYCIGTDDIEDTNRMTPAFRAALSARLAADLCIPITQSQTLAADMWTLYDDKMTRAAVIDASQSKRYAQGGGRISRSRYEGNMGWGG